MSRNKRKKQEVSNIDKINSRVPFNKTIWFKIFSIVVLISLFLVPVLSMLINMIPAQRTSPTVTTQNIEVKN
jgi:hypothetical protein